MVAPAVSEDDGAIWVLAGNIALLSFLAIGGGIITILPELHRQVVDVHGWMTSQTFAEMFAMAQAAPGPNLLVVTFIGYYVGGIPGALLATVAVSAPTCTLAYAAGHVWNRFRQARWRIVFQAGIVPVSIGLVAASAYIIARQASTSVVAVAVTIVSAIVLTFTRLHPILVLAAGGALGLAGLI
jgi:chromate transporter